MLNLSKFLIKVNSPITYLNAAFKFFFKKKNLWFFLKKIDFFFLNFILNRKLVSFFWEIPTSSKNKNKRAKKNFFFFKKSFYRFIFKILNKKPVLGDLFMRFLFINRFFFVFWKKEWLSLKRRRSSLSLFVKKKKMKVNLKVLKSKFYIRNSFFLKKKNKHLFNFNVGFSFSDLNMFNLNKSSLTFLAAITLFLALDKSSVLIFYFLLNLLFFFKKNLMSFKYYQNLTLVMLVFCLFYTINFMLYKAEGSFFAFKIKFFSSKPLVTACFLYDNLSCLFASVVLTISIFVILFQSNYTEGYLTKERFLTQLNFFIVSMLFLVLSNNWILLLLSWEGLGLSSFFLINFFKQKTSVFKSGFKAFCFNRLSDVSLLLSFIFFYKENGSFYLNQCFLLYKNFNVNETQHFFFMFLIVSALVKSAQFFFFFWLPDSMEAPVPASALIHSATLVSAGIYLLLRFRQYFFYNSIVSSFLTVSSLVTMVLFSSISSLQYDLKKLLAFSTISNCGFIYFLISIKEYRLSCFFFCMHGFLKSLCFIIAGFLITLNGHSQDLKNWDKLPLSLNFFNQLLLLNLFNLGSLPMTTSYFIKSKINLVFFDSVTWYYLTYFSVILYTLFSYCYSLKFFFLLKKNKSIFFNKLRYSFKHPVNLLNLTFVYYTVIIIYFISFYKNEFFFFKNSMLFFLNLFFLVIATTSFDVLKNISKVYLTLILFFTAINSLL